MQVNVHEAKSQLSKLIQAALDGEEVVIARGNKPAVKLVPVPRDNGFRFGVAEGEFGPSPDVLAPLSEEELRLWEGG